METIQESPPPVQWAKKHPTEIGLGLIVLAIITFALAIWAALRPPKIMDSQVEFSRLPLKGRWELDMNPASAWMGLGTIIAKPGDTLDISAVGRYTWNPGTDVPEQWRNVTPDGTYWKPADLLPSQKPEELPMRDAHCGGLLIRIGGVHGRTYFVGQHLRVFIGQEDGGLVEFMVNSRYTDVYSNTGYIHLKVEQR